MASHQPDDKTTPASPGQAGHGFEKSFASEAFLKQVGDDSTEGHHTEEADEKEGAVLASPGMAKLLSALDQDMLQEILNWPQPSRKRPLEHEEVGLLSDAASRPWAPMQQASCEPRAGFQPEWQEIDDSVKSIGRILHNPVHEEDARLSLEDEVAVRKLLKCRPRSEEKRS